MFAWISENLATIIICVFLVAVVTAIIISMFRNKKKGKFSCTSSCSACPMGGQCNNKK